MKILEGTDNVKLWVQGVPVEAGALQQLRLIQSLPITVGVAAMPDIHQGIGSAVGTVVATKRAVVASLVSVDIGCGMVAVRTNLTAEDLPDSLKEIRQSIESTIPMGKESHSTLQSKSLWGQLDKPYREMISVTPSLKHPNVQEQLGSLGGGNHFIEICLDTENTVWIMLHSGSRGIGNRVGMYFIEKAREHCLGLNRTLPDKDLGWFEQGSDLFDQYWSAMQWCQNYAKANRTVMLDLTLRSIQKHLPSIQIVDEAVNIHHNYAEIEQHGGEDLIITRKGAVRAAKGVKAVIPSNMGGKSYIVEGLGNPDSYCSCSHGAGRVMSRGQAKRTFTLEDHELGTQGVECRKDLGVLDETPKAYKDIEAVMAAQTDLVRVVTTLKQVMCCKG